MRRITTLLFAVLAAGLPCLAQTAATAPAAAPVARVSAGDGTTLIWLARSAMNGYIRRREPATERRIVGGIANLNNPVAVTLRSNGEFVAQSIKSGASLPVNLATAALEAMRSPQLPDRVTREVLDSLTIEVEVLTRIEPVSADEIAGRFVPGMSGLRLTVGERVAYSLPSASYEFALDAKQTQARCLGQLGLTKSTDASAKWEIFTSMHFVGYPGKEQITEWLYRGKILALSEAASAEKMSRAGLDIGRYLRSNQTKDGCFTAGGERGGLGDHLY
ncbi:MAG: AMMECR1 domain-containing protein, partial [Planctomycetaceae bacterium]